MIIKIRLTCCGYFCRSISPDAPSSRLGLQQIWFVIHKPHFSKFSSQIFVFLLWNCSTCLWCLAQRTSSALLRSSARTCAASRRVWPGQAGREAPTDLVKLLNGDLISASSLLNVDLLLASSPGSRSCRQLILCLPPGHHRYTLPCIRWYMMVNIEWVHIESG